MRGFSLKVKLSCLAGKYGDASETTIPVYPPSTTTAYVSYGEIFHDGDVVLLPFEMPSDALDHFGGLEVLRTESS